MLEQVASLPDGPQKVTLELGFTLKGELGAGTRRPEIGMEARADRGRGASDPRFHQPRASNGAGIMESTRDRLIVNPRLGREPRPGIAVTILSNRAAQASRASRRSSRY